MALDIEDLAKKMLDAALPVLTDKAPGIGAYAAGEFKKIAQTIATIESEQAQGQITEEQASILLEMQKGASRSVLLTAAGLSLLVVEKALNAALDVVRAAVNTAVKFALV